MRLVLHCGMPKAGSTSIQLALSTNNELLSEKYGLVYRERHRRDLNDAGLYDIVMSKDRGALYDYLMPRIDYAAAENASAVLFSAERLFVIPSYPDVFREMVSNVRGLGYELETVIVVRSIEEYMRSQLTQLISNGHLALGGNDLAQHTVNLIRAFWDLPVKVTTISFDRAVADGRLVSRFFEAIGYKGVGIAETKANVTSDRSNTFKVAHGIACNLISLARGRAVYDPEIDLLRSELEQRFDSSLSAESDGKRQGTIDLLDSIISDAIEEYMKVSLAGISQDGLRFLHRLCGSSISCNQKVPAQ